MCPPQGGGVFHTPLDRSLEPTSHSSEKKEQSDNLLDLSIEATIERELFLVPNASVDQLLPQGAMVVLQVLCEPSSASSSYPRLAKVVHKLVDSSETKGRWALRRLLERADRDMVLKCDPQGIVKLLSRDFDTGHSAEDTKVGLRSLGFGDLPIHSALSVESLERLGLAKASLFASNAFVGALLQRMKPCQDLLDDSQVYFIFFHLFFWLKQQTKQSDGLYDPPPIGG